MMCPHMEATLNEYVDGTLTLLERQAVDEHLAQCAGCREAIAELRRLVSGAQQLPPSIAPPRDLWPVIGRRIRQRATWSVQRVWWRGALAAAAVLVIALGIFRLAAGPPDRRAGEGWVAVQADFDRAANELGLILAAERGRLQPETVALLERNLAVIDGAIAESRAALARDPANAELRRLFAAASRQKVELLQWVTRRWS
jgi:predicted anti-sigma-YlaC factor YlaD